MVKYIKYILIAVPILVNAQKRPFVFDKLVEFEDSLTLAGEQIGQWSDISADTAGYALRADSSNIADTALRVISEEDVTRVIYVDSASGDDITGDGTVGAPFETLLRGVQDIKDALIDVDITVNLAAGGYEWNTTVRDEFRRIEMYNSRIVFQGSFSLIEDGFTTVQDATELFKFTLTKVGKTFTEDEFKYKWASNGSRYYMCAGNTAGTDNVTMRIPDDRSNSEFYDNAVFIRQTDVDDYAFNIALKGEGGINRIEFNIIKIETGTNKLTLDNNSVPFLFDNVYCQTRSLETDFDNLRGSETKGSLTIRRGCIEGSDVDPAINIYGNRFSFKMYGTYVSNINGTNQVMDIGSVNINDNFGLLIEGNQNISGMRLKTNVTLGLGQNNVFWNCLSAIELEDENVNLFDPGIGDEALRFELVQTNTLFDCTTLDKKPPKTTSFTLDELYFDTDTNYFTGGTEEFYNIEKGVRINIPGSGIVNVEDLSINGVLVTPFDQEAFSSSKTVDFSDNSFKKMDITGATTINVTNLNVGANNILKLKQNATGYTITIGTGWGDPFDNTGSLGNTANADYTIQFIYDGDEIEYGIVTQGE